MGAQEIILKSDFKNTQIRSQRVELAVAINPSESFTGDLKIAFGTSSSSLTTHLVTSISDQDDFTEFENNTRIYVFEQENLTANTTYYYKWRLETTSAGTVEEEIKTITTPSGFSVLPYQNFEIPEAGLIPGDTIGFIQYEDSDGTWAKVQTYYKTTLGLKADGSLWSWGRNAKKLVVNPASQSEVVYEPIRISMPPDPGNIDQDGDGYWDLDEQLNSQSDPNDKDSKPIDSDNDRFSDAFEIFLGNDPNNENITWEEDQNIFAFFLENFSNPNDQLLFHDFAVSRTAVLAIEKTTRKLYFWGVGMGNVNLDTREYDLDTDDSEGSLPPFNFAIADMATGYESIFEFPMVIDENHLWDKIATSNDYITPAFPNLQNLGELYDTAAAGLTVSGTLFIWGIVDGLVLPNLIQVGEANAWKDVKVGDAIIALKKDGTLWEVGMDIPETASLSSLDKDNDGVSDALDAFEWDPNFQYDNDDDGLPNKREDQLGTDKNNPDSDGDGVMDAEDQLPLNPNYSKDNDFDGLPDELDPNDDNWDSDGDGAGDGWDADPSDPTKRWDCDGDGVDDETEWQMGADPCVLDTDGDGVDDKDDKYPRTWYYQYDSDGDGLPNALELINETDPNNSDSDGDGFLDAIAVDKFNTFRQAAQDLDCSEGWERCDQWQYFWRFWDIKYDCDGNGWVSWEEWEGTSPACQTMAPRDDFPSNALYTLDTDRDGDADEIDEDDDNDGYTDEVELNAAVNTDPKDWESRPLDSDGDQLPDGLEISLGTDPFNWDSDYDGAGDGWDAWPLDPKISWDDDKDKLENWIETNFYGTDPQDSDSDDDGVDDFTDAFPINADWTLDTDGDGLSDTYEDANGLDKNTKDSDEDGYYDAPCDRDKMIRYTDEYGHSWYDRNWRECDGNWERVDTDGDGIFNEDDDDDDNDGILDGSDSDWYNNWEFTATTWLEDKFPTNPNESSDYDNDGIGDNEDTDDDNDGYLDVNDDFPNDPSEWLNTDKPTQANGGLTDNDNDGIFGEDYGNDGWIDELGDHRKFDFIGNNKDPDDDGDLFLDVDEIYNGTDPLDRDDYPGSGYGDSDKDGLSNAYEIAQGTDPKNWDTDGDGVSDGWIHPHICGTWNSNDYKVFIEIPNATATVNPDTYYIELNGNNQNWSGATRISYTVSTSINGTQLLNHFATELNKIGQITYDSDKIATYTATVSGNLLVITQGEQGRKFHFNAFNTVIGENNTIFLDKHDYDSHGWKSDLYVLPATTSNNINQMCETHTFRYGLGGGKQGDNADFNLLRDAFPNNPNEFWDTDGDGIGDKSDTDIDGDGILNSVDPMPFNSSQSLDTDGDGILDNIDPDDDNDWRLDLDEVFNGTDPLDSNSKPNADADNDGLSDSYEVEIGSLPNDWDSDNDGISDGPLRRAIDNSQNWNIRIDIPKADFSTIVGDKYYISINGDNQNYDDRLLVTFDGQTSKTGTELLNYFKTELNNVGKFLYDSGTEETFTASVSGTRLTIAGNDTSKSAHVEAFFAIPGANNKLVLVNHGWRHYWWKSDILQQKDENACCGSDRFDGIGDGGHLFLMDAFPNDPNEFWDTDGDGIGDNTDTDIDGDGYLNSNDGVPFDARDHLDTDNDGIGDSLDDNKDGDNFLDFDDPNPLVFTPSDGGADADSDGFSDSYEINVLLTNPNNWDSDGDKVSDGWQYPSFKNNNFTWTSTTTWQDDFFRERYDDTQNGTNSYWFNYGRTSGIGEGALFIDKFPNDASEYWDTDGDGTGDNEDEDDDNDGLTDVYETTVKRNGWDWTKSDPFKKDTDGDGVDDGEDAIPWYDRETSDLDGDFQGDNEDYDDDGDGLGDAEEKTLGLNPKKADSDGDGWFDGDCIPGAVLFDANGNWRHEISFTGSSTLTNEKYEFRIWFNQSGTERIISYVTTENLSPTQLVSQLVQVFNQNDFTPDGDPMTATASGSILILTGQREWREHHINMWELQRNVLRARPNWCDWVNRDKFPDNADEWQDIDHDDIGDNEDTDDDNDGLSDIKEASLGTNPYYWDSDGDWRGDDWDKLPLDPTAFEDTDGDGIPDFTIVDTNGDGFYDPDLWGGPDATTEVDTDLDGDGISNIDEDNNNTDKYQPDSDWDGYDDDIDVFPRWHEEWFDTDSDGIGNNRDLDDDGDGYSDLDEIENETDALDASSKPANDQDQDFLSDLYEEKLGTSSINQDSDGDSYLDGMDAFPLNDKEWLDSDADGVGNNEDDNDDNDQLNDFVEILGNSLNLWNLDPLIQENWDEFPQDTDNDGLPDQLEIHIQNSFESTYNSADDNGKRELYRAVKGIWAPRHWQGKVLDLDTDNNSIDDHLDIIDFDDIDDDGIPNIEDRDSDGDGADDGWDQAIYDRRGNSDLDLDFLADGADNDNDGDGILNWWERLYGTDSMKADTDEDDVSDKYDYMGYEPRIQSKSQFTSSLFPLNQIGTATNWEKISTWNYGQAGASYAAINSDDELYVWGVNYGALPVHDDKSLDAWQNGEEYGFVISSPTKVRSNEKWKDISLGFKFGIGYDTEGTFYSWGRNLSSQLGNGKPTTYETFSTPKIYLGEITQISAGDQQVGIINKDGKLRMIGSNDQGQLGTGASNDNTPQELDWDDIEGDIKQVKVTETETQIITNQNAIWAYGDNLYAQLGRGTRDTKAENYEAKKIEVEGWTEVYAITEHVYAFKADGTLWAWGKNKNFDLGLGFKSEYVSTPTQVQGVNKSDMKDFSPLNGGFVYIKNNGELWGAGANFYTGSWFPLSSPRKIGRYSDWSRFHDFMNSELNILIEKTDGSIWGAGANWNKVLTQNPCPEPKNQIEKITLTHPRQLQKTKIEISPITGSATITFKVNGTNLTAASVSNTTDLLSKISLLFDADKTLTNNFTFTATPTANTTSTLEFVSKLYKENTFSYSISQKSDNFSTSILITDVIENISGTTTYTVNLSGARIEASADNITDAVANLKTALESSEKIETSHYSFTVTNTTSILVENIRSDSFFITTEIINSVNAASTISNTTNQERLIVDCNPGFVNNLVEIFEAGNDWDQISMGLKHVIGLTDSGALYSWGANEQNQLGLGTNVGKWEVKSEPVALAPVVTNSVTKTFVSVDASAEVSFAIASDKSMYAWGDNDLGTLAVGDYSDKNIPTLVKGEINWKANLGGYRFQVALDEDDTPYGWGYRKFGQLGALGKVKGDDIVWDTDLSESKGIVQTLNGEEYIIATEELVNYLDTVLNFEYSGGTTKKETVQTPSTTTSKYLPNTLDVPSTRKMNVGKWKVKKTKSGFSGKSAIEPGDDSSLKTADTPYTFDIVDVNEKPTKIELTDISSKISSKGEQFISNISVTDPDEDDIITVTIPSNSPNASKFEVKNQKLYFNTSTSKANVPYQVIIRATDWEGLIFEQQFEVLVDEDGLLSVEEVVSESSGSGSYYDPRFIDSDGDGFVDAIEMTIGTDQFDFRSFPTDIDKDGILDFYDGDIDNDGYLNDVDQYPTDPNEWIDADGDGIPDNLDNDDDNDGVADIEANWREGYLTQDLFPNDPNESSDFDRDGIGDNGDTDDDNDGVEDSLDAFPYNPYEWADTDNDSIGDNADEDIDNDGYSNFDEIAIGTDPFNASDFPADQDSDFVPDALDSDIDGDGISNAFDNAPEFYNPGQEFIEDENHFDLILPDFFSPNGDGVNDAWVIGELQRYQNNQVWVYDAAGNLVFSQKQYLNDWLGTNNGIPLPKASYLYMIDADGDGTIDYQGWVFITR